MARTVKDASLETRTARLRLQVRSEPYWRSIDGGLALGYRRNAKGGSWIARRRDGDTKAYQEHKIGPADDVQDSDGVAVFSFREAQDAARKWWQAEERRTAGAEPASHGPYTVADALADYFSARVRKGSKGVNSDRTVADARIVPALGSIHVAKLTTAKIRRWHEDLANSPKLVRSRGKAEERKTKAIDPTDSDAIRARRSSANRQLTVLKAALNHAYREGRLASDDAWRKVSPFRAVDAAVIRYLSTDECQRLVNACATPFRDLVRAAILTGCRYGELTRLRAGDFNRDVSTIVVRESKGGKPRHVVLTDEGAALFESLTAGRPSSTLIFTRHDGRAWKASEQQRPLQEACERASITPPATFHVLRHTHASHLAMQGVPMGVIAAQLGHADTRMTEKHYAHLSPSYVADTIRRHFPAMGIGGNINITPILRLTLK